MNWRTCICPYVPPPRDTERDKAVTKMEGERQIIVNTDKMDSLSKLSNQLLILQAMNPISDLITSVLLAFIS